MIKVREIPVRSLHLLAKPFIACGKALRFVLREVVLTSKYLGRKIRKLFVRIESKTLLKVV